VFGSSRPLADASEGPCVVEVILHLEVHLRRSNELHQEIKCWEAQGRQRTPRKVHALLRSFCILRSLLLAQRKAESNSVLHPLILCEI
jgi:hypothetical protein